jgi:hypothetical protein
MSLSSLSRRRPAYTDQYSYVRGEYAIGDEKVPYFSISMTIREADQYLRLARELAFSDDEPVNLEELFQRTVDEDRAAGPIATYLRQPGSLKFFNAFTVVLLPVDPDKADTVAPRPKFRMAILSVRRSAPFKSTTCPERISGSSGGVLSVLVP